MHGRRALARRTLRTTSALSLDRNHPPGPRIQFQIGGSSTQASRSESYSSGGITACIGARLRIRI